MNVFHFCDSIACYRKYLNKNEAPSFIFRPLPKILLSLMNTDKTIETPQSPRISVAPMMDWTTKDYRFFARLFNPNVILYTEMVTTGAILFGGANRHLDYNN